MARYFKSSVEDLIILEYILKTEDVEDWTGVKFFSSMKANVPEFAERTEITQKRLKDRTLLNIKEYLNRESPPEEYSDKFDPEELDILRKRLKVSPKGVVGLENANTSDGWKSNSAGGSRRRVIKVDMPLNVDESPDSHARVGGKLDPKAGRTDSVSLVSPNNRETNGPQKMFERRREERDKLEESRKSNFHKSSANAIDSVVTKTNNPPSSTTFDINLPPLKTKIQRVKRTRPDSEDSSDGEAVGRIRKVVKQEKKSLSRSPETIVIGNKDEEAVSIDNEDSSDTEVATQNYKASNVVVEVEARSLSPYSLHNVADIVDVRFEANNSQESSEYLQLPSDTSRSSSPSTVSQLSFHSAQEDFPDDDTADSSQTAILPARV